MPTESDLSLPETSVIIRTFNEEAHLPALLDGLKHQTYNDYEIAGAGTIDITKYNPCA